MVPPTVYIGSLQPQRATRTKQCVHIVYPLHRVMHMFNDMATGYPIVRTLVLFDLFQPAVPYIQVVFASSLDCERIEIHALHIPTRCLGQLQEVTISASHIQQSRTGSRKAAWQMPHVIDNQ